jgi:hypothetical protein
MVEPTPREINTPAYVRKGATEPARRRRWLWVAAAGGVLVVALAAGAGGMLLAGRADNPASSRPAAADAEPAAVVDQEDPPAVGASCASHGLMGDAADGQRLRCEGGSWRAAFPDPELSAFQITPRITEKQCFGSAGCHIEFTIEVALNATLDESTTYEVTYEVTGPEDGPLIDTFEITGTRYTTSEQSVSTPRRSTKLTIRPTSILRTN